MSRAHGADAVLFLDANVLVSAAWKEGSEIGLLWKLEGVRLVTSTYVLGEVQRNLHQIAQVERLRGLMRSVRILAHGRLPELAEAALLPEKDRPALAGAVEAKADHLVSGDKRHFGPLYGRVIGGVRITAPSELLAIVRRALP